MEMKTGAVVLLDIGGYCSHHKSVGMPRENELVQNKHTWDSVCFTIVKQASGTILKKKGLKGRRQVREKQRNRAGKQNGLETNFTRRLQ